MRPQPLIAVSDVEASSRWYQRLLGCQSAHGGPNYERLVSNGTLVMQFGGPLWALFAVIALGLSVIGLLTGLVVMKARWSRD